ncbi:Uncharacterised protein [Mycobacteroides abscessus subsp. abscessus]|nr:Uncharacterised protein [Mycobacteroides abscessus subsp. abscessus]
MTPAKSASPFDRRARIRSVEATASITRLWVNAGWEARVPKYVRVPASITSAAVVATAAASRIHSTRRSTAA